VNRWTLAKYALMLVGLALVLGGDRAGMRWLGVPGLALILTAFALRYVQRRQASRPGAASEGPKPD